MRIALFDLDHTLIPFDSGSVFTRFLAARGALDPGFEADYLAWCHRYAAGTVDMVEMHRFTVGALSRHSPQALAGWLRQFEASIAPLVPNAARELEILRVKAPGVPERLSQQVVGFVQKLRSMDLFKLPGVAETLDWAQALTQLDRLELDPETINDTLGTLMKYQDDIARIQGSEANRILTQVKAELSLTRPL